MKFFAFEVEAAEAVFAIEAVHDVFAVSAVGAPVNEVAVVVFGGFDGFVDELGFVEHADVDAVFEAAGVIDVIAVFEFVAFECVVAVFAVENVVAEAVFGSPEVHGNVGVRKS